MSGSLDPERLRAELLEPDGLWTSVQVVRRTGSTNADLVAAARAGAPSGSVLLAEEQTAARGRLDRRWSSPVGALAMSLLVHPDTDARRWTWLPLLTGMAVLEAVRRATGVEPRLKWPNDVLVREQKLAGILLEGVSTPAGSGCVIGIGLNLDQSAADLPVPTATSLRLENASTTDATVLAITVARSFALLYGQWLGMDADGDHQFARAYLDRSSTVGRRVRVELGGPAFESVEGLAEGIDAEGRLLVRTDQGRRAFGAGDVVHVR